VTGRRIKCFALDVHASQPLARLMNRAQRLTLLMSPDPFSGDQQAAGVLCDLPVRRQTQAP